MKTSITTRTAAIALAAIVSADASFAAESQTVASEGASQHRVHRVYPPLFPASAASEPAAGQGGVGRAMRAAPATAGASRNGGGRRH